MNKSRVISLSLVIPCFNEEENLPNLFRNCVKSFEDRQDIEVIFVNNGSTDGTHKILSRLTEDHRNFSMVNVDVNKGYGFGILAGLVLAGGDILAWTHADLQTDPTDVLKGLDIFNCVESPDSIFIKGKRIGRPASDMFFTISMTCFEWLTVQEFMWDISGQPTMFHRSFYDSWQNPPSDFTLDLYAFYAAKCSGLSIERFPVYFGKRQHGEAHLKNLKAKLLYAARTIKYSRQLIRSQQ